MGSIRLAILAIGCVASASTADLISFMDHRDPRVSGDTSVQALFVARTASDTGAFVPVLFQNSQSSRLAVGPLVNPAVQQAQTPDAEPALFLPQQDFWTGMLARSTALMF